MASTISKHIGEGFGKGELYAALAYDATDVFGGMKIKGLYIEKPAADTGNAIYISHSCTATSGNQYGIRMFISGTGVSTGAIRGIRCEADAGDTASASLLEAGLFTGKVSSGTATVTNIRVLSATVSIGASLTVSGDVVCLNSLMQTKSDEAITGTHTTLYLKNEAVGGTGLQMSSWISLVTATLSGGVKGAGYAIDGGTATDVLGTAVFRFGDDQTICSDDNQALLVDISATTNAGFMKVYIGSSAKYIALYDAKTS